MTLRRKKRRGKSRRAGPTVRRGVRAARSLPSPELSIRGRDQRLMLCSPPLLLCDAIVERHKASALRQISYHVLLLSEGRQSRLAVASLLLAGCSPRVNSVSAALRRVAAVHEPA